MVILSSNAERRVPPPTQGKIWPKSGSSKCPKSTPGNGGRNQRRISNAHRDVGYLSHTGSPQEKNNKILGNERKYFKAEKAKIHIHNHRGQQMKPTCTSPQRSQSSPSSLSTGHLQVVMTANTPSLLPVDRTPPSLCHSACCPQLKSEE